jgi:diguanylate cyclase (GGDEF)-like protein/PAS domain S-box-containing protein
MVSDSQRYRLLTEQMYDGVYVIDTDRRITFWNRAAEQITGYTREEVEGSHCWQDILQHLDEEGRSLCKTHRCPAVKAMESQEVSEAKIYLKHKEGHRLPVQTRVIPMPAAGKVEGVMEVFRDVSPTVTLQQEVQELRRLALLDPLTEIGNRRYMERHLTAKLDELERFGWSFGLLLCDIDGIERINDQHGRGTGDSVLKMVARTLSHALRAFDFIGRWGCDEFMAIVTRIDREQMEATAQRLRLLVKESRLREGERVIETTISIGATVARKDDSEKTLIERVEQLLAGSRVTKDTLTMDTGA